MPAPNYPTIDVVFIIDKIIQSGKVIPDSQLKIGSTITFVMDNNKPMHKRHITLRHFDGQVNFMQATGKAILFGFMGDLLKWYEEHRNWKEGGYIAK